MNEDLKAWLLGTLKSWTAWFGAVLIAAPEIIPAVAPHLAKLMTPERYQALMQLLGVAVILLRVKTTTSLKEKGTPS